MRMLKTKKKMLKLLRIIIELKALKFYKKCNLMQKKETLRKLKKY